MPATARPKQKSAKKSTPSAGSGASFDHRGGTRLVFGAGSVESVGELTRGLDVKKVLLVTDPGIIAAGHASRVERILKAAGVKVSVYGNVRENPTTRDVDDCSKIARAAGVDGIVGLGGGSSMDTAKGCNFLLTNGGRMQDYWGIGKANRPMLPLVAIPTTAGTGSECQSFALIADERTHQKMACGDAKAAARVAILDPALTLSQPARVAACTGVDALTHAVETAVTRKRNALSLMYSREAFRLVAGSLARVLSRPDDLEARGRMLLGAAFAGTAIENSMLGAAHSAANPLTAHYGIVHGQAVGMMLPAVVRFNSRDAAARRTYAELAGDGQGWQALVVKIEGLLKLAKIPRSLAECGVKRSEIKKLAADAARQWTAGFNPRPVMERDFVRLYEETY